MLSSNALIIELKSYRVKNEVLQKMPTNITFFKFLED